MSTILNSLSRSAVQGQARQADAATSQRSPSKAGIRGLTVMLLAAVVSAMVVLADQYVGVWTEEHLLFAWVILWAVVFAVLALFASTARAVAVRTLSALDSWSLAMAENRAEARMWAIAKTDPRMMAEISAARGRRDVEAQADTSFEDALAPMGLEIQAAEPQAKARARFSERLMARRAHRLQLHYI